MYNEERERLEMELIREQIAYYKSVRKFTESIQKITETFLPAIIARADQLIKEQQ